MSIVGPAQREPQDGGVARCHAGLGCRNLGNQNSRAFQQGMMQELLTGRTRLP